MRRGLVVLAASIALVAPVTACSDDEPEDVLTREEFIERATEVCEEARDRIVERGEELDPNDPGALNDYVVFVSTEVLDEIDQLRELGLPDGDERLLDQALSVYEDRFTRWQNAPEEAVEAATDKELAAAGEVLEDYGLPACGADV